VALAAPIVVRHLASDGYTQIVAMCERVDHTTDKVRFRAGLTLHEFGTIVQLRRDDTVSF
jgi:hypothetical protein